MQIGQMHVMHGYAVPNQLAFSSGSGQDFKPTLTGDVCRIPHTVLNDARCDSIVSLQDFTNVWNYCDETLHLPTVVKDNMIHFFLHWTDFVWPFYEDTSA